MQIDETDPCQLISLGAATEITCGGEDGGIEFIALFPKAGLSEDMHAGRDAICQERADYNRIISFL